MKTLRLIIWIAFLPVIADAQSWQWANSGGGANFDMLGTGCIAIDKSGNTYVTGSFYDKMTIDTILLTGNGWNKDVFWAKFDKDGKVVWAKSIGGKGEENDFTGTGGIVVDSDNNVYVFLSFSDTIATPEIQAYNSGMWNDLLLIKCDSNGKVLNYKSWGTPFSETAHGLSIDVNDKVYLYGTFAGYNGSIPPSDSLRTLHFDSTHSIIGQSQSDFFIVVVDSLLTPVKALSTLGGGNGYKITIDKYQNVIISGSTAYKIQFDTVQLSDPDLELFVAKYDSSGNALWARMGKAYSMGDYVIFCATGSDGSVYCTGTYDASSVGANSVINFDNHYLQGDNAFIIKYDANGALQWAKNIGTTARDAAADIAIDSSDNIYITGRYDWRAKFGNDTFYSAGADDIFVNKYDKDGNHIWTATAGGATNDGGYAITLDKEQNIYVGGYISSNPGSFGNYQVSSNGAWDMCVAKLSPAPVNVRDVPAKKANAVHIAPNPNTGSFSIYVKDNSYQQLQITDVTGKAVHRQNMPLNGKEKINVETKLNSGMYFLKLTGKEGSVSEKFIVHE